MVTTGRTPLQVTRPSTFDDLDAPTWSALTPSGGFFTSRRFMTNYERIEPEPGVPPNLLVVHRGDVPVCMLPFFRSTFGDGGRRDPFALAREIDPDTAPETWRPTTMLGARAGYDNRVFVNPEVPAEIRGEALRQAIAEVTGPDGGTVSWSIPYLDTASALEYRAALPDTGDVVLAAADCVIDIPEDGLGAYLDALPRKRRAEVRREMRRFAETGHGVELAPLRDCHHELADMMARRLRKYGSDFSTEELARIFAEDAVAYDGDAFVLMARSEGRPLAFVTLFRWGTDLIARSWGFGEERANSAFVYFNLAYYEPIRRAAELGVRRLQLGILSYEAKVRRGAVMHPRWTVLESSRASGPAFSHAVERYNAAQLAMFRQLGDAPWEDLVEKLRRHGG